MFSQVEHAAGMLRVVLPPELVKHIDFATLALCPGSFIDEALKERYTDLLFSALVGGRPALLCLKNARTPVIKQSIDVRRLPPLLRMLIEKAAV